MMIRQSRLTTAMVLLGLAASAAAQTTDADMAGALSWRSIGPAVMSGRIVDVAVVPGDPSTFYAASGSGGLWKTTNRGGSFKAVFDDQAVISIGDVALAPSNPDVVWVGTGEANNQRSSYWGDGVYKSTDGGDTWEHMGLPESHHIGRIVVHPSNPDIVYVAALGHLYSKNAERGLYRTRDGGKAWELVKHIDADTGVVDVVLDPTNPDTLFAASYQRRRRAWDFGEAGPGSGIWRSRDGGDSWERLAGGLPSGAIGRIGIAMFAGNSSVLYATIENRNERTDKPGTDSNSGGNRRDDAEGLEDIGGQRWGDGAEGDASPGVAAPAIVGGEVYKTVDGGDTWEKVNERPVGGSPPYYYGQIRIDPTDQDRLWMCSVGLYHTEDGGKTWKGDGARGVHADQHALWIDPEDPDHMLLGNDGGLCRTYDRAKTWDVYENLPLAQFYAVAVDNSKPYRIYGGLQDNGSWGMPSVGRGRRGIQEHEVARVNGGDGFYCAVDPEDPNIVYSESQFGRPSRLDLRTLQRKSIRPPRRRGEPAARYNWNTPIVISPHNARTIYIASQRLHRSLDRGDTWEDISPDLTTDDAEKKKGNVPHCTITTVSESTVRAGVIWVGTDDGKVSVTQDGGKHWRDVTDHFPAKVRGLWVSRVEASPHDRGTCYVSFTGYREDQFTPYVFVTDDYGGNWTSVAEGLPASPVNVIRGDPKNKDLLFVGTEQGAWASLDAGDTWHPLDDGIPTNAVHDLAIQNRECELVAATHGRGFYVLDFSALRHLGADARDKDVHLCPVKVVAPPSGGPATGSSTSRTWRAPNPRFGANVVFWLGSEAEDVSVEIQDVVGNRVATVRVDAKVGMNTGRWNLSRRASRGGDRGGRGARSGRGGRGGARGGGGGGFAGFGRGGGSVAPGTYVAVLKVGDTEYKQPFTVERSAPNPSLDGDEEEEGVRKGRDL
ncbi:MAG: hypothetical protein HRU14_10360 [Planctomycetes bacterium]|nr:hypothetical protein [Planctomycetota bacterium]